MLNYKLGGALIARLYLVLVKFVFCLFAWRLQSAIKVCETDEMFGRL